MFGDSISISQHDKRCFCPSHPRYQIYRYKGFSLNILRMIRVFMSFCMDKGLKVRLHSSFLGWRKINITFITLTCLSYFSSQKPIYVMFIFMLCHRILAGCSFTGNIPPELGNLQELSFLYEYLRPYFFLLFSLDAVLINYCLEKWHLINIFTIKDKFTEWTKKNER